MRLIDADEFIRYLCLDVENAREENIGEIVTLEDFDRQPTYSLTQRHGEWNGTVCSACGESTSFYYDCNFCPMCGAKMDM